MYACTSEIGSGFFAGVCTPSNATAHLHDPPPSRFANGLYALSTYQWIVEIMSKTPRTSRLTNKGIEENPQGYLTAQAARERGYGVQKSATPTTSHAPRQHN
jgi:hypothetical protein